MPPETITLGGNRTVSAGVEADWSREVTRAPVISAVCFVNHAYSIVHFFSFARDTVQYSETSFLSDNFDLIMLNGSMLFTQSLMNAWSLVLMLL